MQELAPNIKSAKSGWLPNFASNTKRNHETIIGSFWSNWKRMAEIVKGQKFYEVFGLPTFRKNSGRNRSKSFTKKNVWDWLEKQVYIRWANSEVGPWVKSKGPRSIGGTRKRHVWTFGDRGNKRKRSVVGVSDGKVQGHWKNLFRLFASVSRVSNFLGHKGWEVSTLLESQGASTP